MAEKKPAATPPWAPGTGAAIAQTTPQAGATPPAATPVTPTVQTTPPAASITPPTPPAAKTPEVKAPEVVEVADELVDTVTVTVPKAFKLRLDGHQELTFAAGVQEMERVHAEHWYSKANGVTVYKAK